MAKQKQWLVLCLHLLIYIHSGQFCGLVEIGQQYTITSTAKVTSADNVLWQLGSGTVLYDTKRQGPDKNFFRDLYVGTIRQLTIVEVSKNDGTHEFRHFVNESFVFNCILPVYKKAVSLTCEPVTLTGNQITTTCNTAQVFPKAKCQFTLENGDIDRRDVLAENAYITYNSTDPKSGGNEFYSTSCTLQYPVNGLKPGTWTVQVNMYPDLIGVSSDLGTLGDVSNNLTLAHLSMTIHPDNCPKGLAGEGDTNVRNGYIRQGERASCECTRVHPGNPPGRIGWNSTQGDSFVILSQSEDAATMQINFPDTFTCQSTSVLDVSQSQSITYTPKYAYGPSEVTISLGDHNLRQVQNEALNLCSSEGLDLTVICAVRQSDVRPGLTVDDFTLTKYDAITTQKSFVNNSDAEYRFVNTLKVTTGGSHRFLCEARNPKFSDIRQNRSATFYVRKPPSTAPVVSTHSNRNGDGIAQEDEVNVTCAVFGGSPPVHSVTLTCGQTKSVTSNGTSTKLILKKMDLSDHGIYCVCQATHITGCYDSIGVLSVNPSVVNKNEGDTSTLSTTELVLIVIGSIGTFVLVAVIILIVFKRPRARNTSRKLPPLPRHDGRIPENCYGTLNSPHVYAHTISSNGLTDRNQSDPSFNGYVEPDNLDPYIHPFYNPYLDPDPIDHSVTADQDNDQNHINEVFHEDLQQTDPKPFYRIDSDPYFNSDLVWDLKA